MQGIRSSVSALLGLIPSQRSAQELFVQGRDKGQHQAGSLHRLPGKSQPRKADPEVSLAWMSPSWELGVPPDKGQQAGAAEDAPKNLRKRRNDENFVQIGMNVNIPI